MITVFAGRDELVFDEAKACYIEDDALLLFGDTDATQVLAGFAPGKWDSFRFGQGR